MAFKLLSLAGKCESRLKPYVDAQLPLQDTEQPSSDNNTSTDANLRTEVPLFAGSGKQQ
jgi:hypothetical protein